MFHSQKIVSTIEKIALRIMMIGYVAMILIYAISIQTENLSHWLFWVSMFFFIVIMVLTHMIHDKCQDILNNEAEILVHKALSKNKQLKKDIEFVTGKELKNDKER